MFCQAESYLKVVGRTIVLLAFLSQCVASIFLYYRRAQRGAATMIDQLVFAIAIGGIGVCILTLGVTIRNPLFHNPVSRLERHH
jgi:hypothetical protein